MKASESVKSIKDGSAIFKVHCGICNEIFLAVDEDDVLYHHVSHHPEAKGDGMYTGYDA